MILFILFYSNIFTSKFYSRIDIASKDTPILVFFFQDNDQKSIEYYETWKKMSKKYINSSSLTLSFCNCSYRFNICRRFSITNYPTFLTINNMFYKIADISENNMEEMENAIKNSAYDETFCKKWMFDPENAKYPAFIARSSDTDPCLDMSKYKAMFPQIADRIYQDKWTVSSKISFCYSQKKCIHDKTHTNIINFIDDFIVEPFGNWSFNSVQSIRRRLALIVYDEKIDNRNYQEDFSSLNTKFREFFLFGKMPFQDFVKYAGIHIRNETDAPFLILSNQPKTKFMIVSKDLFSKSIFDKENLGHVLSYVKNGHYELQMKYYFDPNHKYNSSYKPENIPQFALAGITVILFTAALIIQKAQKCIKMKKRGYNRLVRTK